MRAADARRAHHHRRGAAVRRSYRLAMLERRAVTLHVKALAILEELREHEGADSPLTSLACATMSSALALSEKLKGERQ